MNINQFTNWQIPHNIKVSPNGDYVVFAVTQANEKNNCYDTNLWIYKSKTGEIHPLTTSNKDSSFIFLNDTTVLFQSSRSNFDASKDKKQKGTYFWKMSLLGGEAQPACHLDLNVTDIKRIDQTKFIVSGFYDFDRDADWTEIEDLPFWLNGQDYISGIRTGLYILDSTKTEDNLELLTDKFENVNSWELSEDKKTIVYSSTTYEHLMPLKENLFSINLDKKQKKQIEGEFSGIFNISFKDDSNIIIVAATGKKYGINEDPQIYEANLKKLKSFRVSKDDFDHSPGNSVGSDSRFGGGQMFKQTDKGLLFIETKYDDAVLACFKDGEISHIIDEPGSVECFDTDGDLIYYIAMKDLKLPELFIYDGTNHQQISSFSEALKDETLAQIESFDYLSNGSTIRGYVIKPLNYEEGKKYPALLEVHGGPKTVLGTVLHHEMQYFASHGYFVFFTNPHGSDGHGIEFSDIRGKYGTIDYEDLMNFTDIVLDKYPDIDTSKVGVLGGSYGGFMTNWIIGHTNRFHAANSQRSISNWLSFYGVSDIGYYFAPDQTAGNPWDAHEKAWEQSPLKYAENVNTPTLFIHSDHDFRCPLEQGMQMYSALSVNEVDTRLVVFKNETHELSRSGKPKSRIKRLQEISDWFKKYLKK